MSSVATAEDTSVLEAYRWETQPAAERLVHRLVAEFLGQDAWAARFAYRLHEEAGVRFADLVDHVRPAGGAAVAVAAEASAAGFRPVAGEPGGFAHPGGIFPRLVLGDQPRHALAVKVERVADFLAVHDLASEIVGRPGDRVRSAVVSPGLLIIERHGDQTVTADTRPTDDGTARAAAVHAEAFRLRRRSFADDADGFVHAARLIDAAVADLGVDYACDLFFAAEREFWQRRNRAARVQKERQDRLGIGWANHDHHTYRSSRPHFAALVGIFEKLGFHCRERFYPGREAGWGAQVLEQPTAGIVIFADVDLSPDELLIDFAHDPLPARAELGTVGLWCALHGESFLEAGMHHLECTFDFAALKAQFEERCGITVMKPFTDLPHLRQAFTQGERWPVREERVARLVADGRITPEQAAKFRADGAIGSHLENLERNEGFKGFNQTGVTEIIHATDPRKQPHG